MARVAGEHAQALEQRCLLSITPIPATGPVPEGVPGPIVVGTFTDTTPSLANDYTAKIVWGDGTTDTGTVTANSTGIYTVTGVHGYPDENAGEKVTVTVVESDAGNNDTATILSTLPVSESDTLTGTLATFSPNEGKAFTGTVATFSDVGNADAVNTDFTAVITWGDGTSTTGIVPTGTNFAYTVNGTHTYPDGTDGPQTVTVVLSDDAPGTATGTATGTIDVQETPFTVTAVSVAGGEGVTLTPTVAKFTDPGTTAAAGFTASIDWGDGTTTAGTVAGASGNFSVTGSHAYADEGSYTISTTVNDLDPNFTATPAISTATVTETDKFAPISGVFSPFSEGMPGTLSAFFSDANMANTADDMTAVINWGDGTTSAGTVTGSAGTFTVAGVHSYTDEQTDFATATITDDAPGTATASITGVVTVAESDILGPDGTLGTPSPEGLAHDVQRPLHRHLPVQRPQRLLRHHHLGRRRYHHGDSQWRRGLLHRQRHPHLYR